MNQPQFVSNIRRCTPFDPSDPRQMPLPVERATVLRTTNAIAHAQAELLRYLVDGPTGAVFAFDADVIELLADGLTALLEIEGPRLSSGALVSVRERDAMSKLHSAIDDIQKAWTHG